LLPRIELLVERRTTKQYQPHPALTCRRAICSPT
jgi:hypothetical protein